jgi:hypothetical protein
MVTLPLNNQMQDILVKFKNHPALEIQLDQTVLSNLYKNQLTRNLVEPPIFRDPCLYTIDRFRELTIQAKELLGWEWASDDYHNLEVTTLLHKNIEEYVGSGTQGFYEIPIEHDNLIHDLHYCIHAIQAGNTRGQWLQLEWFNDDGFALPDDFEFKFDLDFGDIKLQNPYVGHNPLFVYLQNDYANIMQTCRFHDLVRPGINIVIEEQKLKQFSLDRYFQWYEHYCPEFVELHGRDKITRFTGNPVIGRVLNLTVLEQIAKSPTLELDFVQVL